MLPGPLHPAVHIPIVLAALAPFFAAGALWATRRGVHRVRAWGIATLLLGGLVGSSWLALENAAQPRDKVEPIVSAQPLETREEAAGQTGTMPAAELALDRARTQCGEARDHYARIMLLVRNLKNAEAGAEMLASTEHLARALRDAGYDVDQRTAAVLREARAEAARLIKANNAVPLSIGMAIEALGAEVDRAAARLGPSDTGNHGVRA